MPVDYIAKGLRISGQLPLDDKLVFPTLTQMQNLGIANSLAFEYYKYMKVLCQENGRYYVWEPVALNYTGGVLPANYQYPPNTISLGIVYSSEYYNWVLEDEGLIPDSAIGKPFVILKNWSVNTNSYLEPNDCVLGFFDSSNLILARYIGGPLNSLTSFAIMDDWNPSAFN